MFIFGVCLGEKIKCRIVLKTFCTFWVEESEDALEGATPVC